MLGNGIRKGMENYKSKELTDEYRAKQTHDIAGKSLLILVNIMLSLLVFGCESNKFAQCEQIFQIARDVNANNLELSRRDREQLGEVESWLQAAATMDRAADKLEALNIDNSKSIQYQSQLATIYRIYSQATYDAVSARENQNLASLKSARSDAEKAGQMQRNLVREIDAFCVDR